MRDAGMDVPTLDRRTSVTGLEWLWAAFYDLTSCRSIGMEAGPIPWTAIQHYAEAHRLDEEETYTLHAVVRHMDEVLRSDNTARSERTRQSRR